MQCLDNSQFNAHLLWRNLFCIDNGTKIPTNHQSFEIIKALPQELLLTQINVLRPKIIILANGLEKSVIKARYQYFPNLKWYNHFNGIPKNIYNNAPYLPKIAIINLSIIAFATLPLSIALKTNNLKNKPFIL